MTQKKTPQISIIIPVYNSVKYIRRCIDSVLAQTFRDIEVLLLDDASTDGTQEILAEYERKYPDIVRVVLHENLGIAGNRNMGIDLARGKYLMFIDDDDYVEPDYCEVFYREIEEGDYDTVLGGFNRTGPDGQVLKRTSPKPTEWAKYLLVTSWAKINRTAFIRKNDVKFSDTYGEDMVYCMKALLSGAKTKVITYTGYNWFSSEDSVTNTIYRGFHSKVKPTEMLMRVKEIGGGGDPYSEYFLIRSCIYYLLASGRNGTPEGFVKIEEELFGWLAENLPHALKNKYQYWGPSGEYFKTNLIVLVFTLVRKLGLIKLFAKVYCKGA